MNLDQLQAIADARPTPEEAARVAVALYPLDAGEAIRLAELIGSESAADRLAGVSVAHWTAEAFRSRSYAADAALRDITRDSDA